MRITFRVDGGFAVFPGLARPVSIDVDRLPAPVAKRLRSLVDESRFFERPEPAQPKGAADLRQYLIEIDDGVRHRMLTVPDTEENPALKALVALLQANRGSAAAA